MTADLQAAMVLLAANWVQTTMTVLEKDSSFHYSLLSVPGLANGF